MTTGQRLVATGLRKSFGATRALVAADLEVRPGEVHTVAGENGSGKSTLVKILAGVHRADGGALTIGAQPADRMRTPKDARRVGIATVFQEVLTVPGRSILDNICLGAPGELGSRTAQGRRRATDLLARLLGEQIDVDRPIDDLSLSQRQACCVARALLVEPSILILDESTSALDIATRDRLFTVVRELTGRGVGVVFISHRMDEVFEITDVVSVLRSGATVAARVPIHETSVAGLVTLMSGADHLVDAERPRSSGEIVLRADGVLLRPGAGPVSLQVRAGELVGLAGLEGQGQDRFLAALRGLSSVGGVVERVHPDGAATPITSPSVARRCAIAHVPKERRHAALFEQLSIRENFGIATMKQDSTFGMLRPARTERRLAEIGGQLRLTMRHPSDAVTTLSGGNQQKVVLARALADRPAVLLLDDPTRGIDLSAKQDVYRLLANLCESGTAVVMVSSEVDELVELVDRVLVFRDESVAAVIERPHLSRAGVVAAYFGVQAEQADDAAAVRQHV